MIEITELQIEALEKMARMSQAVTTLDSESCSGGWALPDSMACPECGAKSDGVCGYDGEAA